MTAGLIGLAATAAFADSYEVKPGDTLSSIARSHDEVSSWKDLYELNKDQLTSPHLIFPGQRLSLSGSSSSAGTKSAPKATTSANGTYTVQAGDTLAAIARKLDGVSSWKQLAKANGLRNPHLILPGQVLKLSGESTAATTSSSSSSTSSKSSSSSTSSKSSSSSATQASASTSTWDRLAQCESNGNWSINTGNGYYGGLQFALSSWKWVGGSGYPHQASKAEQIRRAEILLDRQGWGAWPACSRKLGLR